MELTKKQRTEALQLATKLISPTIKVQIRGSLFIGYSNLIEAQKWLNKYYCDKEIVPISEMEKEHEAASEAICRYNERMVELEYNTKGELVGAKFL